MLNVSARSCGKIWLAECLQKCHNFVNKQDFRLILILRGFIRAASVAATAATLMLSSASFASPIGYSVRSDVDGKLYRLDMATGVATEIGATGFSKIEALAINSAGEIYGVNPVTAQLVKCSASTGICKAVGTLVGLPQVPSNAGLAFASSGALYLAVNAAIYFVDPATAAVVALGPTGPAISGLAGVTPSATCASGLYAMGGNTDRGKFYCINTTTGVATLLGTLGITPLDVGLDGDPVTGLVWGISDDVPGQVFAINPATLAITNINTVTLSGKPIGGFESLAIARTGTTAVGDPLPAAVVDAPLAVPTLSFAWLAALSLLLATAAALVFRARKFALILLRK